MHKSILTTLGCSGSIAMALMSPQNATANPAREYTFTAPETNQQLAEIPASETDYPFFDCTCSEYDAATLKAVDKQGEKAIATFGCDCAGCRRLVSNNVIDPSVPPHLIQ